jgi:hypothetical protein
MREDGTYPEKPPHLTEEFDLKEEKKKWEPLTEAEKKLLALKKLLQKIKVPEKPKKEFINPKFDYE